MKIEKRILSKYHHERVSFGPGNPKLYLTIHETDNWRVGADAEAHHTLQLNKGIGHGWHWQVDDKIAIQSFSHDWKIWTQGDGRGPGNTTSISMEICVNKDGDYKRAVKNATLLAAKIMHDENIPLQKMVQHYHWTKKNCPSGIRAGKQGMTWTLFVKWVKDELDRLKIGKVTINQPVTDKYRLDKSTKAYKTAQEAKNNKNNTATYAAGDYSVYKRHDGMINITKTPGKPGGWINPNTTRVKDNAEIKVGDTVKIKKGAKSFEGVRLASFVYNRSYVVYQLKGDRAVVDKGGINTAFNIKDLYK